jgi:hypothetical protein
VLTTLAMVAALLVTPSGKTVVNLAEVTGQGTATLTAGGTFSCTSRAVTRLTVTVDDRDNAFNYAARVVVPISCPAADQPYTAALPAPGSVWWHRKLTVYADLSDQNTVRAATSAPVDEGTLQAVAVDIAELKGGNLVVSGTATGTTITVSASQGEVHGEVTIPLPANKSYAIPVRPANAKVFLSWQPVDFVVTAHLAGHAVDSSVSGTFTPTRRPRPVPRTP